MIKYNIALCIFLLSLLFTTYGRRLERSKSKERTSSEFDVLIFTQRWPFTACFAWKESSNTHSCSLPKRNEWTIHGVWPTKFNTLGPEFCNRSLSFNKKILAPLEDNLKENWIDIQNGSTPYSFWKHEWDKHGTCAVTIKELNNEYKYFNGTLYFHTAYNMLDVLAKASIVPGRKYMVDDMLMGIQKVLNKNGQIMCVRDEITGEFYVHEIRICFDKTLQLTDCNGIKNFPTNCKKSKPIIYPSSVPHKYNVVQI